MSRPLHISDPQTQAHRLAWAIHCQLETTVGELVRVIRHLQTEFASALEAIDRDGSATRLSISGIMRDRGMKIDVLCGQLRILQDLVDIGDLDAELTDGQLDAERVSDVEGGIRFSRSGEERRAAQRMTKGERRIDLEDVTASVREQATVIHFCP